MLLSLKTEEDNSTSSPLPVVITVDKVRLSVKSFVEQGITIEKTVLDVDDVTYASDGISVDKLFLKVDTNVTDLVLYASLDEGKLVIEELSLQNIDSVELEKIFLSKVPQNKEVLEDPKEEKSSKENTEPINPLIPKKVELKHFVGTLKPRPYKTATVDKLEVVLADVNADIIKILKNEKNALMIGKYSLDLQSDIAQVDLVGDLKNSIVTLNAVNIKKVDSLLIQTFLQTRTVRSMIWTVIKRQVKKLLRKRLKKR